MTEPRDIDVFAEDSMDRVLASLCGEEYPPPADVKSLSYAGAEDCTPLPRLYTLGEAAKLRTLPMTDGMDDPDKILAREVRINSAAEFAVEPNTAPPTHNSDSFPLTGQVKLSGYTSTVPVVPRSSNPEAVRINYGDSLVRSAHSRARAAGSEAANAATVLGPSVFESGEASALGPIALAMTAYMMLRANAVPAAEPRSPYDVRLVQMPDSTQFMDENPGYTPLYIRSGMPAQAAAAFLALYAPGGPGAYNWQYQDGREPFGAKYHYPSGQSPRVLVVVESGNERLAGLPFDGRALTCQALEGLLDWYERGVGLGGLFPLAWRTAAACLWGYGEVTYGAADGAGAGMRFANVPASTVHPQTPAVRPEPPGDRGVLVWSDPLKGGASLGYGILFDNGGRELMPGREQEDEDDLHRRQQAAVFVARGSGPLPEGLELRYSSGGTGGAVIMPWAQLREVLGGGAFASAPRHVRTSLRLLVDDWAPVAEGPPAYNPGRRRSITEARIRNVFGQVLCDGCVMQFPASNRDGFLGLLAGISVVSGSGGPVKQHATLLTRACRLPMIGRRYAALLHVWYMWGGYRAGLQPDVQRAYPLGGGAAVLREVPVKLRCALLPSDWGGGVYQAPNFECLENGASFGASAPSEPGLGLSVPGEWVVSAGGRVRMCAVVGPSLSALDCAARYTYMIGGTITVVDRIGLQLSVPRSVDDDGDVGEIHPFFLSRAGLTAEGVLTDLSYTSNRSALASGSTRGLPLVSAA